MPGRDARLTLLRLIEEHEGQWGWYQFERAFPPDWFSDEPPTARANDLLDQLVHDGLVMTTAGDPHGKYRLTDRGVGVLRASAVPSDSA